MKTALAIVFAGILIGGAILVTAPPQGGGAGDDAGAQNNVAVENGTQYVDITAKGGYRPRNSTARAGMPTVLRMKTSNTFDCSIALSVPTAGFSEYLPQTGVTEIPLPAQQAGAIVRGTCAMGMYNFSVAFK